MESKQQRTAGELLLQGDQVDWFAERYGTEPWTTVYDFRLPPGSSGTVFWCCLSPRKRRNAVFESLNWDLDANGGTPGMSQGWKRSGKKVTHYLRFGNDDGLEPIVVGRHFPNHREGYAEISEELRHAFNLYEDFRTRSLYEIDDAGNEIEVARVNSDVVEIRTSLLRRFQALKRMDLLLLAESDIYVPTGSIEESELPEAFELTDADLAITRHAGMITDRGFSRVRVKKLLRPPKHKTCGLWFYKRRDQYVDFIVGEDEMGHGIEFTSNPDRLANYFGKNPDNPHYLTPVFFKAAALQKYYDDHDRYEVADGYLSAHGAWGVRIDNDNVDGVVSLWLGDLGRDLPTSEQRHWRGFNIPPTDTGVGETAVRRQLLNQWAPPRSPEHRFKRAYAQTNEAWDARFGWPLFKALHKDDKHALTSLRLPADGTPREFDLQVLNLAKLLVDSLNEDEFVKSAGRGPSGEKGIAKFERFLNSQDGSDAARVAGILRDVQGLRSRGSTHRKATDFDIEKIDGLTSADLRASYATLLDRSTDALDYLRELVATEAPAESGPHARK